MVATSCFGSRSILLYTGSDVRNFITLNRNSAGHTLFLFFGSFRGSKSALCHLLCEATYSLRTDKQGGNNMTAVDEYSKVVTAQQLGDKIMHITLFGGSCTFHVSNIIVGLRKLIQMIIKLIFFVGEVI